MPYHSILKKLFLAVGLFLTIFFSVLILREFADIYFRWVIDYVWIDLISFILTVVLLIFIILKNRYLIAYSLISISLLTFTMAGVISAYFGNSDLWHLKYLTGFITGAFSFLLLRNKAHWKVGLTSVFIALLATGVGEKIEYISTIDPPSYPSFLYNLFPLSLWQSIFILSLIVLPAYFFSQGNFIKKYFSR